MSVWKRSEQEKNVAQGRTTRNIASETRPRGDKREKPKKQAAAPNHQINQLDRSIETINIHTL